MLEAIEDVLKELKDQTEFDPKLLVAIYLPKVLARLILNEHQNAIDIAKNSWEFRSQIRETKIYDQIPSGGKNLIQWRNHLPICLGIYAKGHYCTCGAFKNADKVRID